MIAGTPYWIGTGIYIDNIQEESAAIAAGMREESLQKRHFGRHSLFRALLSPASAHESDHFGGALSALLRATTDAAEKIAVGNFDIFLESTGRDEVSVMQNALNSMAVSLRNMMQNLSQKEKDAFSKAEEARLAMQQAQQAKEEFDRKSADLLKAADELENVAAILSSSTEQLSCAKSSNPVVERKYSPPGSQNPPTPWSRWKNIVLEVAQNAAHAAATSR